MGGEGEEEVVRVVRVTPHPARAALRRRGGRGVSIPSHTILRPQSMRTSGMGSGTASGVLLFVVPYFPPGHHV